jgi:hypothetical protein
MVLGYIRYNTILSFCKYEHYILVSKTAPYMFRLYFTGCFGLDECYNFCECEGAKKVNWDIPTDKISQDMLHSDHLFCTCPWLGVRVTNFCLRMSTELDFFHAGDSWSIYDKPSTTIFYFLCCWELCELIDDCMRVLNS